MLVIEMVRHLRRLPPLVVLGLAVMAAGGAVDVVVHVGAVGHHSHAGIGAEHVAHLAGIAGMLVVLAGVVIHGIRRSRRHQAASQGGLARNANR